MKRNDATEVDIRGMADIALVHCLVLSFYVVVRSVNHIWG